MPDRDAAELQRAAELLAPYVERYTDLSGDVTLRFTNHHNGIRFASALSSNWHLRVKRG